MANASKSGLFEVWGGFLIEGDCVTPTRIHTFLVETFPTSEAIEVATQSKVFHGLDYVEIRFPKNYLDRMAKLNKIKRDRRNREALLDPSVPF
jgi:hypothetical protein